MLVSRVKYNIQEKNVAKLRRHYKLFLTRAPLGGHVKPPPILLYICQTNGATNAKLSVTFGISLLHPMCNKNFVPTIDCPPITSEWRHVRVILMHHRVYMNRSPGPNLYVLTNFFLLKWRRIDRPTELLSRIFKNVTKNYLTTWKIYIFFSIGFSKKRNIC